MRRLLTRQLPLPTVCYPHPLRRRGVITNVKSRIRETRSPGSVEGVMSKHDPYSDYGSCLRSSFRLRLFTRISNEVGQNRQGIRSSLSFAALRGSCSYKIAYNESGLGRIISAVEWSF